MAHVVGQCRDMSQIMTSKMTKRKTCIFLLFFESVEEMAELQLQLKSCLLILPPHLHLKSNRYLGQDQELPPP